VIYELYKNVLNLLNTYVNGFFYACILAQFFGTSIQLNVHLTYIQF